MATQNVFVYGTLKNGEPNQHWLTNENNGFAKYLGNATTLEKYPLVIASRYNIPFLLDKQGIGQDYRSQGVHGLKYCEPEKRDEAYDACSDVQGKQNANKK